jgi:hypothetical protein
VIDRAMKTAGAARRLTAIAAAIIVISCALALSCVGASAASNPAATATPAAISPTGEAMPGNPLLVPPFPPQGKKMEVGVGLHILNIASIDEVSEQFTVDGYLLCRWTDPRLAFNPAGQEPLLSRVPLHVFHGGDIWTPKLEIVNGASGRTSYDIVMLVSPNGNVNYAERFHAVVSAKFALRRFPFDTQRLPIIIQPFYVSGRFLNLELFDHHLWSASEFNAFSSLAQWQLTAVVPEVAMSAAFDGTPVTEVRFQIDVTRKSSFYVWKVFIPLLLMVLLSWAVFWIEAGDLPTQVTVAVTTILTVIAFAFAISATMPRVPYLTYIDAFFLQCYVFVFLAMFELMMVHVTHRSDRRRDIGIRLRAVSRIVIPSAFILSNILIAVHFLG